MTTPIISRRTALAQLATAGAVTLIPGPVGGAAFDTPIDLGQAATEAWLYGLPLIEGAANRAGQLAEVGGNAFKHHRKLATPADRWVTSPNNDTLYSSAWIDLAQGPVTLALPEIGERYASFQFMDISGRTFAVLGARTTGSAAQRVTVVAPGQASADPFALQAPTPWIWFLARFLVNGADDLPAVWRLQDALGLQGPPARQARPPAKHDAPWPDYFESVQSLLKENPPPLTDTAFFRRISTVGLGPTSGFTPARFEAAEREVIAAAVMKALAAARSPWDGQVHDGWLYPIIRSGGTQSLQRRAQIALTGIGGLPPDEAIYIRAVDPMGRNTLSAERDWRIHFAPGAQPPVDGFWSLSMYEVAPDGKRYFSDNAIGRYAIGDRTPGLTTNSDGSLDLWLARRHPGGSRSRNWLPLPASPQCSLTLRAYLPKSSFLSGDYRLPPILPMGGD